MSRNRNAAGILLACLAVPCTLAFLAQPGGDLPQQSPEAIEAQLYDAEEIKKRKAEARRLGKGCAMYPCWSWCDGSEGHGR